MHQTSGTKHVPKPHEDTQDRTMPEHEQVKETSHTDQHRCNTQEAKKPDDLLKPQTGSEGALMGKSDRIHFLVADDNKIMGRLVTRLMERLGHDFDLVVNGKEAVEAYKRRHPVYQCVLMDVAMPVMGGIEAMRLIRTFESENGLEPGNIVALIADDLAGQRDRMRTLGFTMSMRKPFRAGDLNNLVDELGLAREAWSNNIS